MGNLRVRVGLSFLWTYGTLITPNSLGLSSFSRFKFCHFRYPPFSDKPQIHPNTRSLAIYPISVSDIIWFPPLARIVLEFQMPPSSNQTWLEILGTSTYYPSKHDGLPPILDTCTWLENPPFRLPEGTNIPAPSMAYWTLSPSPAFRRCSQHFPERVALEFRAETQGDASARSHGEDGMVGGWGLGAKNIHLLGVTGVTYKLLWLKCLFYLSRICWAWLYMCRIQVL